MKSKLQDEEWVEQAVQGSVTSYKTLRLDVDPAAPGRVLTLTSDNTICSPKINF